MEHADYPQPNHEDLVALRQLRLGAPARLLLGSLLVAEHYRALVRSLDESPHGLPCSHRLAAAVCADNVAELLAELQRCLVFMELPENRGMWGGQIFRSCSLDAARSRIDFQLHGDFLTFLAWRGEWPRM